MKKTAAFVGISVMLHLLFFQLYTIVVPTIQPNIVVEIVPVERIIPQEVSLDNANSAQMGDVATTKEPVPEPDIISNTPVAPVVAEVVPEKVATITDDAPVEPIVATESVEKPSIAPVNPAPTPVEEPIQANETASEPIPESVGVAILEPTPPIKAIDNITDNSTDNGTSDNVTAAVVTPAPAPVTPPPPKDGKADIKIVQTFISDRIHGQIEFDGNSRKLTFTPKPADFRLSGNTTVKVSFKIDRDGNAYDIDMPPVAIEVERLLVDFVTKMRFSAVLYNVPDVATMTVTLKVK